MNLYLKDKGKSLQERANMMDGDAQQKRITSAIASMQVHDFALRKSKFEVAYFIAKEELPLSKYSQLLKLHEKHGVAVGIAYCSDINCGTFIDYMGEELGIKLRQKLTTANFYSVLIDGSEDVSVSEKEALFVQYLDPNPAGKDTVQIVSSFMKLSDLKHGTAVGIVDSIQNGFQSIEINSDVYQKKLVGLGADGATVNRGTKEGVVAILQRDVPWLVYVWCVAHRLELSLKDALKGSCFTEVDEMLLRLYYLYENSPKKLRQLRELYKIYKQSFEFEEVGIRPERASGRVRAFTMSSLLCYPCEIGTALV